MEPGHGKGRGPSSTTMDGLIVSFIVDPNDRRASAIVVVLGP